jgi:hypothetical protein
MPDDVLTIEAVTTSGRPYLRQLATRSGMWFSDLRNPESLGAGEAAKPKRRKSASL